MIKLYAVKQNPEQFKDLMRRELHEIITDEETNGYISIVKCADTSIENLIRKARTLSTRELDSEKYVVKKIYGKTKAEARTRLLCARLDPSQFECNLCVMGNNQPGGMDLGIELRYSHDSRWSLFGYVPNDPEMPVGRYILTTNVKTTLWPCICGSKVVMNMHMIPLSATIATLRSINQQKMQA